MASHLSKVVPGSTNLARGQELLRPSNCFSACDRSSLCREEIISLSQRPHWLWELRSTKCTRIHNKAVLGSLPPWPSSSARPLSAQESQGSPRPLDRLCSCLLSEGSSRLSRKPCNIHWYRSRPSCCRRLTLPSSGRAYGTPLKSNVRRLTHTPPYSPRPTCLFACSHISVGKN
jgi:hypothetical protein